MKVLIFGQGQLGTYYKNYYQAKGDTVINDRVDIRDANAVHAAVESAKPDLVINAAAKTDIDWCEQHRTEAFEVNTLGADTVAAACAATGTYLYQISSGCVQESKSAEEVHTEDEPPTPLCFYSWTKVWAENLVLDRVRRQGLRALILRPRQLLSATVSPRNAVTKFLTYKKFIDTPNSCTIVEDLLDVTDQLVTRGVTGVYNVVNPGIITPFQVATLLKEIVKPEMEFVKISKDELNAMTLATRVDCVLSGAKLESLGIQLKEIHERLAEILHLFKQNLAKEESIAAMAKTEADTAHKLGLVRE